MHFFGNTKLFCHFLLADIEKVLYIYMPFYDGMGTFKGGNCSTKEDVPCADYVFMADMWNPKHLITADTCGYLFLGKMVLRC